MSDYEPIMDKEPNPKQFKRNELLQVATQLAVGMFAAGYYDIAVSNSILKAKDLIAKVDKECGE